jgi:hypothetical protein
LQPEHAAGELRSLLPAEVTRRIDWSTLRQVSESFIDPLLRKLRADLVFSVKLDGRAAYFYVLLEHQSTAESCALPEQGWRSPPAAIRFATPCCAEKGRRMSIQSWHVPCSCLRTTIGASREDQRPILSSRA